MRIFFVLLLYLTVHSVMALPDMGNGFTGGIAVNGNDYQKQVTQNLSDSVDIQGDIQVLLKDRGKTANLVVYAEYLPTPNSEQTLYFMLDQDFNILAWDQDPETLVAFEPNVTLSDTQMMHLYSGKFVAPGRLKVYFGYQTPDYSLFVNVEGIDITILDDSGQNPENPPTESSVPVASPVSLQVDPGSIYQEVNLIGSDPEGDTLSYELLAPLTGEGYFFAYVYPSIPKLFITLDPSFTGTLILPYRVTDGTQFSDIANITLEFIDSTTQPEDNGLGLETIDPRVYAGFDTFWGKDGLLGAPGEVPTLPSSIDLSGNFPVPGVQGRQNSCVGWAVGYALKSYQEKLEEGWSLNTQSHVFSPAFIYNQINKGQDGGSLLSDAFNLVVSRGAATLDLMPYDANDYRTQPDNAVLEKAAQFKADGWSVAKSTHDIKTALANRLAVAGGIIVYDSLRHLSGSDSVYNQAYGQPLGGHAITIVGYDDNKYGGAFKVINSWGTRWGDNGYFWLPYDFATSVTGYSLPQILVQAFVLKDADNRMDQEPNPTPVPPPVPYPTDDLPNLVVKDWGAAYDSRPGGEGTLEYQITNTGQGIALKGANISLMLSTDRIVSSNDIYIVYEPIQFDMESGDIVYRDQNNAIPFTFPTDIAAGEYYMALWIDDLNQVAESDESDNIGYGVNPVSMKDTLADLSVESWYTEWDDITGDGTLEFSIRNEGVSATTDDYWTINLVLTPDDVLGNGNDYFVFSEATNFVLEAGGAIFRDQSSAAAFNIFTSDVGRVPNGTYYVALWIDDYNVIPESDEGNNYSFAGSLVQLGNRARKNASKGTAYNGRPLFKPIGKITIADSLQTETATQRTRSQKEKVFAKQNQAASKVIFPVGKRMPMK